MPKKNENRASFSLPTHIDLVSQACEGHFVTNAIAKISQGNLLQDANQFTSNLHFDNCTFAEGAAYYAERWNVIESAGDPITALHTFGQILHSVQDFYAHSNWVELHVDHSPIPLWNFDESTLPNLIVSGTWSIGFPKKCGSGVPSHEMLNKDNPDTESGRITVQTGPNTGSSLFQLAYASALAHSKMEVRRFEGVIHAAGLEDGVLLS
jgi:heterokaryon incompatibility protein Het-C